MNVPCPLLNRRCPHHQAQDTENVDKSCHEYITYGQPGTGNLVVPGNLLLARAIRPMSKSRILVAIILIRTAMVIQEMSKRAYGYFTINISKCFDRNTYVGSLCNKYSDTFVIRNDSGWVSSRPLMNTCLPSLIIWWNLLEADFGHRHIMLVCIWA